MNLSYKIIESPLGPLSLIANENALTAILWGKEHKLLEKARLENKHPVLLEAEKQLKEYFQGKRKVFNLALDPEGTPFQKKVWQALQNIPFGRSASYGDIARAIGSAKAARAVGGANNKNPLSIIIPCHRVIGSKGSLTGYAGGIATKSKLLNLENISHAS